MVGSTKLPCTGMLANFSKKQRLGYKKPFHRDDNRRGPKFHHACQHLPIEECDPFDFRPLED